MSKKNGKDAGRPQVIHNSEIAQAIKMMRGPSVSMPSPHGVSSSAYAARARWQLRTLKARRKFLEEYRVECVGELGIRIIRCA